MRLFERGGTQAEVSRELGLSRTSASRRARIWEVEGTEGLHAAGRAARKPRLDAKQLRALERALWRGLQAYGYQTELWTLGRMAEVMRLPEPKPTEPIVCTPGDAIRAFKVGQLDYLAIGGFVVKSAAPLTHKLLPVERVQKAA